MKVKTFKDEVYDVEICVIWGCDLDEMIKTIRRYDMDFTRESVGLDDGHAGCVLSTTSGGKIIWLKDAKCPKIVPHEVFHLCSSILKEHSIPCVTETEETYAYYFGYLHSKITALTTKKKKKAQRVK